MTRFSRRVLIILFVFLIPVSGRCEYDPLSLTLNSAAILRQDFAVTDEKRSREIPIRVYLPREQPPAAVVLFSHGLGGNREGCAYLGEHWAARGYVTVFLQHPGSDDGVWRDVPLLQRMPAMKKAAGYDNFMLRVQDVPAVLDQLEKWNVEPNHPLSRRMDLQRVGMSGHSFGAVTTQALTGQRFPFGKSFADGRIKAAVAMSPSPPVAVVTPKYAFGNINLPWMLLTGTNDASVVGNTTAESRLSVYPALPAGDKFELVLNGAEHSAFTDRALPGDTQPRNPNHHRAVVALTTAFWDAYLRDDPAAKEWLGSDRVRAVLEQDDRWKSK